MFAFDRTISRLLEIQSVEYVQSSLAAHPQGPDWILQVAQQLVRKENKSKNNDSSDVRVEGSVEEGGEGNLLDLLYASASAGPAAVTSESDLCLWDAFVQMLWKQYRIGSIDEAQRQPVQTSGKVTEEVLRWEDAAVCLADLAEFATRLTQRPDNVRIVQGDGEEEELVRQVQQKVLPDRFEALVQRRLTNDWGHGHHFITYAAFSQEGRELLLQVTRLRSR